MGKLADAIDKAGDWEGLWRDEEKAKTYDGRQEMFRAAVKRAMKKPVFAPRGSPALWEKDPKRGPPGQKRPKFRRNKRGHRVECKR